MARLQEIAVQISSLKELSGVIAAIRVMATAQMQQGERALEAIRKYAGIIRRAFAEADSLLPGMTPTTPARADGRKCLVIFCSEHGFCGGFNQPLISAAVDDCRREPNLRVVFVGSRGALRAVDNGVRPSLTLTMATDVTGVSATARRVAAEVYRMFIADSISTAEMLYMRQTSDATSRLERSTLLPFEPPPRQPHHAAIPLLVNMPPGCLRNEIAAEYMFATLEAAAMESFTSENAARFRTMQAAHENIERKTADLVRLARRMRQEALTAEILELISGAEALKQK